MDAGGIIESRELYQVDGNPTEHGNDIAGDNHQKLQQWKTSGLSYCRDAEKQLRNRLTEETKEKMKV